MAAICYQVPSYISTGFLFVWQIKIIFIRDRGRERGRVTGRRERKRERTSLTPKLSPYYLTYANIVPRNSSNFKSWAPFLMMEIERQNTLPLKDRWCQLLPFGLESPGLAGPGWALGHAEGIEIYPRVSCSKQQQYKCYSKASLLPTCPLATLDIFTLISACFSKSLNKCLFKKNV